MVPGSLGHRGLAWLLDILMVVGLPGAVITFSFWAASPGQTWSNILYAVMWVNTLLLFWLAPLYFALFHRYWGGQTPGKRLTGIRVVSYDGTALRSAQSLGRSYLQLFMFGLFYIPWIVDSVWPLFEPERRSLHDLATGTEVIQA